VPTISISASIRADRRQSIISVSFPAYQCIFTLSKYALIDRKVKVANSVYVENGLYDGDIYVCSIRFVQCVYSSICNSDRFLAPDKHANPVCAPHSALALIGQVRRTHTQRNVQTKTGKTQSKNRRGTEHPALQLTATRYNTLQHTATHCNSLQHTCLHPQARHTAPCVLHRRLPPATYRMP
jgi:hypothetical protein